MSKMNAVILCRISDQKQDDGYSLDAQERFGVEYCNKKNFNVLKTFRFVETGSKVGKRAKFDSMMDFLREIIDQRKNKEPIHLVVEKPDRLTRNFTNREQIQFFVMMGALEIHFYKDRRVMDKNCSPADIFTDDMMTSVSKYIALNIAREVKKGSTEKARNGWFPAHPPMGYKYVREGAVGRHGRKEARIIINEELKPIIYRVFEMRAVEKKSYEAISNLIRNEFTFPKDKKYKFTKSTVEYILLNKFYGGTFDWMGETYKGKHELFIPQSWVELAQVKMRGTPHLNVYEGPFSHMFKCAVPECGCQIIYDPKTKINRTTGEKRVYHYYHCTDSKRVHKKMGIAQVNIPESKIWAQLTGIVQNISLPPSVAEQIALHFNEQERQSLEDSRKEFEVNRKALEILVRKQDQFYEDLSQGIIDEEDYRRMKAKNKEEIARLKLKLENNYQEALEKVRDRLKFILELAKGAESNWKSSSPKDRLVLLKNVASNFWIDGLSVRYDLKKVFGVLSEIKQNGVSKSWCPTSDGKRTARALYIGLQGNFSRMVKAKN